jgi:hypothetical protein
MTGEQLHTLERLRRRGYAYEYSRRENNGIVRVACVRRLRMGIMYLLIRPDGTYRGANYARWDVQGRTHT